MVLDQILPSVQKQSFLEWTRASFEMSLFEFWGHAVALLVEALRYKPEVRGSVHDEIIKFFN
jgi:hypothetical protein